MVDKLHISFNDFEIGKSCKLQGLPPVKNLEDNSICGLHFTHNGEKYSKLYHNEERLNVTIGAYTPIHPDELETAYYLTIGFNPNKVIHDNNYTDCNQTEVIESIDLSLNKVKELGLDFDLNLIKSNRVDIGGCLEMSNPVQGYLNALSLLPSTQRRKQVKYGDESIYYRNKSVHFLAYDKHLDLLYNENCEALKDKNPLRMETALKKNAKNKLGLQGKNFKSNLIRGVGTEISKIINQVKKLREIKDKAVFNDQIDLHQTIMVNRVGGSRYWLKDSFTMAGVALYLNQKGEDAIVNELKNDFDASRSAIKSFKTMVSELKKSSLGIESRSIIDKVNEIEDKFNEKLDYFYAS